MAATFAERALLIAALARRLPESGHVVAGAISPLPAAAALLAQWRSGGRLAVTILGSTRYYPFTDGGAELFDAAGRGRIDAFFLSGGQIDGQANINLVGTGAYPTVATRFPGSFGSAYLYYVVPNVILFRAEHSRRTLVAKVDFVSAPGTGPPGIWRPGGPSALVTGRASFAFDRERARFRLETVHPGETVDSIVANTGFDFDHAREVPTTPVPSAEELAALGGPVRQALAATYPEFAAGLAAPGAAADA